MDDQIHTGGSIRQDYSVRDTRASTRYDHKVLQQYYREQGRAITAQTARKPERKLQGSFVTEERR